MEPVSNAERINKIRGKYVLPEWHEPGKILGTLMVVSDVHFLLSELDRWAEVAKAYRLESAHLVYEDNRKLREELDREKSEWLAVMRREQDERRELLTAIQSIQQERDKLIDGIQRAKRLLYNPMAAGAYRAGVLDVFREIGVGEERT